MKRQRGIAIGWLYLIGVVVLLGAITGLVVAWDNYTTGLDEKGYDRGVAESTAAYTKRDNVRLQRVLAELKTAQAKAKALEEQYAAAQATADANYKRGVKDGQAKTAARIAAARAGDLKLRDPGNQGGTGPACNPGPAKGETATTAAGGNAAPAGQLPGSDGGILSAEASTFLLALTGEADEVVKQLTAAQATIVQDRVLCNSP